MSAYLLLSGMEEHLLSAFCYLKCSTYSNDHRICANLEQLLLTLSRRMPLSYRNQSINYRRQLL